MTNNCQHNDVGNGAFIRPNYWQLVYCRDCQKYLCWLVDGQYIHKSIKEIWREHFQTKMKDDPRNNNDEGLDPEVYTFIPIKTKVLMR